MILNGCKGGSYQLTTTKTMCFTSLTTTTTVCKENILDGRRDEQFCSPKLLNTSRPVPTVLYAWNTLSTYGQVTNHRPRLFKLTNERRYRPAVIQ